MKKISKQTISVILSIMTIFSTISFSFVAFAAEEDETVETVVTSDVMSVEPYEVEETYEEEIECEVQEFVEGDDTSVELSENDVVESMNLTNGVSDLDLGIVEDRITDPVDNGETYQADNKPLEDTLGNIVESEGVSKDQVETDFAVLNFAASQENVIINQGGTAKVELTYWGFYGGVKVCATKNNGNVSGTIQKKSSTKFEMTISGDQIGTTKIVAKLYSSKGVLLKEKTITVTVKKSNYITVQKNRIDLLAGKSAEIGVNFYGSTRYSISTSPKNNCEVFLQKCNWVDIIQLGYKYKLVIKGTNVGTTKITVYQKNSSNKILDQKTITLNVTRNATITPSLSSVSVDIGNSKAVSFTNKNAYGSLKYSFSLSNANCALSWNGQKLTITGKRAGNTKVTVQLTDGKGNYLASTSISVTVKRNPKLTPNMSTVNLIPAQTSKVNIKLTGYDGGVYAKYSSSNASICGIRWSGSWSNNSITMTVYGYKQGTTKIIIYLYSSSGQKLTETSVTVNVTGVPSIKADSSFNVNMGAQKSFLISVSNIASNYKLSLTKSGSSFTGTFDKSGNNIYCNIKGTKEGSGSVFVTLKSEDGTVLATKTIPVKILWVENPQITVSNTNPTIMEGKTGSVIINCTGTKKQFNIKGTYSRYKNEPQASVQLTTNTKSNATLSVSCNKPTIARIELEMVEKSTGKVLATKMVTFDVFANTAEFNNLTYGTRNYTADIPLSTFRYMYDYEGKAKPSTLAKTMFDTYHSSGLGGLCYGFATTSVLFNSGTVSTKSFGASSIKAINNVERFINPTLNISAKRFIEGMFIMQYSQGCKLNKGISDMCNLIKSGNKVLIAIFDNGGGHALIGYKFDEARNRIYVCDSNTTTDSSRYIQLKTNIFGAYSGWSYKPLGWDGGTGKIKYQTLSNIRSLWSNRANVHYDDSLETMVNSMNNVFITNSSDFNICDVEGNILASYANNELVSNSEDIYMVETMSYIEDPDYPQESIDDDIKMFYLPRAFYVVDNKDDDIDSFEAQMINYDYGVSISTEADQVAFGVDDTCDLCTTSVSLEKGEEYDITLLSSREGEENIRVEGEATAESVELGFAMVEGQLTETNSDGATVNLNGVADNYYKIEATSTEGGSISPEGTTNLVSGSDFTYSINADEGYFISEVLVDGEPVGSVEEYTFYSVDRNSTIEARFEKNDLTVTDIDVVKDGYNVVSWKPARTSNGYEVYRKHLSGDWQKIADVESDVLDYIDKEITSNFYAYSYSIRAYSNLDGEKIYGSFDETGNRLDSFDATMTVSKLPDKTEYYEEDILDVSGLEITLTYSDNTYETYASGFKCDITVMKTVGEQDVGVSFHDFSTSFKVKVNKLYYNVNWNVDGETSSVVVKFGEKIEPPINPVKEGYIFKGWTPTLPNSMPTEDLTFTAVFEKIVPASLTILQMPTKTVYDYKDENIDLSGMKLEITYSDGSKKTVADTSKIKVSGFLAAKTGEQKVTVEYEGMRTDYTINVKYTWWQWIVVIVFFGWIWY